MGIIPAKDGVTLVIAPHPDDEVLGCGGTIARLSDRGCAVDVAIVTTGRQPRYSAESVEAVRAEAIAAHATLGVRQTHYLDLPAADLDRVPHGEVNAVIGELVDRLDPDTLLLPFIGDIHRDHQLVFHSSMVAARPRRARYPTGIYAYETLSETNWSAPYLGPPFVPNVYVDITDTLERKLDAFALFESQRCAFPNERSPEALRALAMMRGATVHRQAAEGFVLIREVMS